MIDPLGFSLIPKEKQEEIRKEAEVFAWKFRFCTYEDDRDLRNIVARSSDCKFHCTSPSPFAVLASHLNA